MVSSTVQLAQSPMDKFEFNAAAGEFTPPATATLNSAAKEFKFSPLPVQNIAINFDSFSSDDESPRVEVPHSSKRATGVRVPPGIKIPQAPKSKALNVEAKEFVPHKPTKRTAPIRPPPGLEKSLGLSVLAKEFVPVPAPVWQCVVNLDEYTDDESDDETVGLTKAEKININEWRGVCGRLASPHIWSNDKEDFMDEVLFDSDADTTEPSSLDSETEGCSGCESP